MKKLLLFLTVLLSSITGFSNSVQVVADNPPEVHYYQQRTTSASQSIWVDNDVTFQTQGWLHYNWGSASIIISPSSGGYYEHNINSYSSQYNTQYFFGNANESFTIQCYASLAVAECIATW